MLSCLFFALPPFSICADTRARILVGRTRSACKPSARACRGCATRSSAACPTWRTSRTRTASSLPSRSFSPTFACLA
eukprot:2597005-Rhodomonas_salina.1